ncbi:MAG: NOL1/NOP2/sun family putative RNA methylase [Archaeoglobaceae archaeon]|nr:NOL1/NOP2/sun family putative RNA methylase [Archaeoglobaceae archaeon]MDW8118093.1 NOL1/NOP2/sun family putative RNA methylase [Archaeoglobaceae archaeon]
MLKEINPELFERLLKIDRSRELFVFLEKPLRKSVRINTLKADLDFVLNRLSGIVEERIPWCEEGVYVKTEDLATIPEHQLGVVFSQSAVSMIPPLLMELEPGMVVLDLCASPGAKTTQIAQYMANEGCLIANDVKLDRINMLISNLQKCGVLIARVTMRDGRKFAKFENKFDSVLVDAPCSNLGMIRKSFTHARGWKLKTSLDLSRLQKELIMAGYRCLKPGGVLIYSTCTLEPLENEEVVDHLLRNSEAKIEEIKLPIRSTGGFKEFDGRIYLEEVRKCLRIHPQMNDTEGFFVAKLRK